MGWVENALEDLISEILEIQLFIFGESTIVRSGNSALVTFLDIKLIADETKALILDLTTEPS